MLRTVAVVLVVGVVGVSCSSPSGQDATPDNSVPVVTAGPPADQSTPDTAGPVTTEATTTTVDRSVPAAGWLSVSQDFGGSMDGVSFRGALNIVNGSDSVIAASFLMVEYLQDGAVNDGTFLVENGEPLLYLTPGPNWFTFRAGATPIEWLRLRPPEAEYTDLPGSFDTTIEIEPRPDGTLVSGTVVSDWPSDLENVSVHIVWFDPSGRPILGLRQIAPNVVVGQAAAFEIETSVCIDESWTYVVNTFEVVVGQRIAL